MQVKSLSTFEYCIGQTKDLKLEGEWLTWLTALQLARDLTLSLWNLSLNTMSNGAECNDSQSSEQDSSRSEHSSCSSRHHSLANSRDKSSADKLESRKLLKAQVSKYKLPKQQKFWRMGEQNRK